VFERGREARQFKREDKYLIRPYKRAALNSIKEGGQALRLDL